MTYGETLAAVGTPVPVAAWGTSVLLRPIPGTGLHDAMGPYPVCALSTEAQIEAGLEDLRAAGAVSVVLVADPLSGPPLNALQSAFSLCRPFKTHHIIDRALGPVTPSKHHADRIRRGERHATGRKVDLRDPLWLATWCSLYDGLVRHRNISGLQAFSPSAFAQLATLPTHALSAFAAQTPAGDVLAMQLWVHHGELAYSHLTATSSEGYRLGATYVVYAEAIRMLTTCRWLDLGGGAGTQDDPSDSLASFKRGFANTSRPAHLCGAVLDANAYHRLTAKPSSTYFPAYRAPATEQIAVAVTS